MPIDELLLRVYLWVDDRLIRLGLSDVRARGPASTITDAEVITLEIVGSLMGMDRDLTLFRHFRRYHSAEFPALARIDRTTFVRQAANLWAVKRELQESLAAELDPLGDFWLVDSMPVHACVFGRGRFCKRFAGSASYAYEHGRRATFYGFRLHVRVSERGVIRGYTLTPASVSDVEAIHETRPPAGSAGLGDRGYWSPVLFGELAEQDIKLYAPFNTRKNDPDPERSTRISKARWLVETVQGQLAERYNMKRPAARDLFHLEGRINRIILSHTVAAWLCRVTNTPGLRIEALLAA